MFLAYKNEGCFNLCLATELISARVTRMGQDDLISIHHSISMQYQTELQNCEQKRLYQTNKLTFKDNV